VSLKKVGGKKKLSIPVAKSIYFTKYYKKEILLHGREFLLKRLYVMYKLNFYYFFHYNG